MLLFVAAVSAIIASLLAIMKKEHPGDSETKLTLGIKTFIVSFVVIYFGLVFFTPNINSIVKTQEIETCDPDF